MRRSRPALLALTLFGLILGARHPGAEPGTPGAQAVGVTIEDFSYLDTSGEPADQTAIHQGRLQAFTTALRGDVEADRRYLLVPPVTDDLGPAERMEAAARAGARFLIIGSIQKMSTLVQWAQAAVVDVGTYRILFEKRYSFRGDNDEAWDRARTFISRELLAVLAGASAPIELAVFDFELEDTTAAALAGGVADSDVAQLVDVTNGVRELLSQSGRYHLVDVSAANAEDLKTHRLRDCGGCEAGIAARLGAAQSLTGVIRRISRTEYTIRFLVRDSRTGAIISGGDSGLRMGADYSWRRGAVRLISDRLLNPPSQQ